MKNRIMGELKKVFRPEFLNRIDDVIVFHKLTKDEIKEIVDLLLLRIRESMAERELQLELSEPAKDLLVDKGWDPAMGARPLRRAIQRYIEDPLADFVLRSQVPSGSTVLVEPGVDGHRRTRTSSSRSSSPPPSRRRSASAPRAAAERSPRGARTLRGRRRQAGRRDRVALSAVICLGDTARAFCAPGRCCVPMNRSARPAHRNEWPGAARWRQGPSPVRCSGPNADAPLLLRPRLLRLRPRDRPLGRSLPGLRRVEHAGRAGPGRAAHAAAARVRRRRCPRAARRAVKPVALADVSAVDHDRLSTGIGELDNVLGGGIVPGSLVLIGGAPGIGKSTLTTMALANLCAAGRRTLYVSAEESAAQIRLRAQRLGGGEALAVPVIAETDLHAVLATLEQERPEVCVIDSVQTLHSVDLSSAAGSVAQVREVAGEIMRVAKQRRIAVLLVGHVTKEGALAGPRVLEHLVDCVLQFEGERERTYRTVRAIKNRFGSTNEAGVFEMRDQGLVEVLDASARFLAEATRSPGSVVLCAMEGSRPLLVEVQALVSSSELVPPRRVVAGLDRNRVALVLAVLGRHAGIGLGNADVFVNVVGGVRVDEPGADLAVALAVASAAKRVALTGSRTAGRWPASASWG